MRMIMGILDSVPGTFVSLSVASSLMRHLHLIDLRMLDTNIHDVLSCYEALLNDRKERLEPLHAGNGVPYYRSEDLNHHRHIVRKVISHCPDYAKIHFLIAFVVKTSQ